MTADRPARPPTSHTGSDQSILVGEGLGASYSGVVALRDIDLTLAPGEITAVIGPNGAGKTTLCRVLLGLHPGQSCVGRVLLNGADITAIDGAARARSGLVGAVEEVGLARHLNVEQNIQLGTWRCGSRLVRRERLERAFHAFPELYAKRAEQTGTLSGGQLRMVAVARAIARAPRVLILDEPSNGLAPAVVGRLLRQLPQIAATGVAVLLVEQAAITALEVADFGVVLHGGREAKRDRAAALLADGELASAYFGAAAL